MDGMNWVQFMRVTENKMAHLHKAMDVISLRPDYVESVSALTAVLRDYQMLLEKAKFELHEADVNYDNRH